MSYQTEILIPITFFITTFAAIFGLRYMVNKERMAMIEKGIDISFSKSQPQPYKNLKWGLLLIGLGLGLFIAYLLDFTVFNSSNEDMNKKVVFIYFSLMAIFGGLGLFISYLIEKKETLK
ncbi:DUF6249 domain-containing protein [Pedobacter alpinus]|uniref:DUF6249 domain-containing protein n=1 Tax=Pedobacter alpinus TaxID=1590643 RepID=A0ABW5TQB4_9SPHI